VILNYTSVVLCIFQSHEFRRGKNYNNILEFIYAWTAAVSVG